MPDKDEDSVWDKEMEAAKQRWEQVRPPKRCTYLPVSPGFTWFDVHVLSVCS